MHTPEGQPGNLYEQVLDHARREIDEASSKIDDLRRTLRLLEARVEAAKSVYESVAARLNLEDELEDEDKYEEVPYAEAPPPLQEPEPVEAPPPLDEPEPIEASEPAEAPAAIHEPEVVETPEEETGADNGPQSGFPADLVRQHLEQRARKEEHEDRAEQAEAPATSDTEMDLIRRHLEKKTQSGPGPAAAAPPSEAPAKSEPNPGFPELSEEDRRLIGEHLRRRAEADRDG
ncbi:MAG: hypothetical protein QGI83_23270 [Candidatus Latescibacteria bacterium]|nr:hypothetical protein [Candidatus Latescibacterota bacterium]